MKGIIMRKKRRDGVRIEGLDGYHNILPYVMPKRTEAEVSLTETFDVTKLLEYMKERNEKEGLNLKFFHAFCTLACAAGPLISSKLPAFDVKLLYAAVPSAFAFSAAASAVGPPTKPFIAPPTISAIGANFPTTGML